MEHRSDVQKETPQEHQWLSEPQNIVYIQQHPQDFRNSNYTYYHEGQTRVVGNHPVQEQNANFEQFENHYPLGNNGHFSAPSTSTTIISNAFDLNKSIPSSTFQNAQFFPESDNITSNRHHENDTTMQYTNGNFHSLNLQSLNYQQPSPFFLQNLGNNYQINENLAQTYQSSGSSESSDESSISNVSQLQYSSDSSSICNNQFEFPVPVAAATQPVQNFNSFQQKDFLENYVALLQQDAQIPRCDSSKSEAAESTCSSLSSGSIESQGDHDNVVKLPLLVNSVIDCNADCNILQAYQSETQNNISSYSNPTEQSKNEFINSENYANQTNHNALKCNNLSTTINPGSLGIDNVNNINSVLPTNSPVNNVVVMLPNGFSKNMQNCIQANQAILSNPSSQDVSDQSKFAVQNPKVLQQRMFGFMDVANTAIHKKVISSVQTDQIMKLNNTAINHENCSMNNGGGRNGTIEENVAFNSCHNNGNNKCNHNNSATNSHTQIHHSKGEVTENCTSLIQNTSDSSVINSNFIQSNLPTKGIESENDSAMLLKETSDKCISESASDVNSSVIDPNSVYLIKGDENNAIKNKILDLINEDTSGKSSFMVTMSVNKLPVPVGWKRLLVDGSVIYLSPTNVALSSIEQVKLYLQTMGTCKCGLECPLNCDSVFNFNPKVISRPWESTDSEQTRLCNHKRKASISGSSNVGPKNFKLCRKEVVSTKRRKKKNSSSGCNVSVSQLIAQRDRALAAAVANRWPTNSSRIGNVSFPNKQYQSIQIMKSQKQLRQPIYDSNVHYPEVFKQETPARGPDEKGPPFSCINMINNAVREGTVLNINGMSRLVPENNSSNHELMRSAHNLNSLSDQMQGLGNNVHPINYNQCGPELMPGAIMATKSDGIVLAPQGMLFSSNMIMQKPRSVPPWHQSKHTLNKKAVPETAVYERVTYVQKHLRPPSLMLDDVNSRKKSKANSKLKKIIQETTHSQPSFMDNPSAYLAQQTALLHNTISRPNFNMTPDTRSDSQESVQHLPAVSVSMPTGMSVNISGFQRSAEVLEPCSSYEGILKSEQKTDRNNCNQVQVSEKNALQKENITCSGDSFSKNLHENTNNQNIAFNAHLCPNTNYMDCKKSRGDSSEQQINLIQENLEKPESRLFGKQSLVKSEIKKANCLNGGQTVTIPIAKENNSPEENPVTSTTEKVPVTYLQKNISDLRPIQGGTISTSNGSPQPQPSPNSSSYFRQDVSSTKQTELVSPTSISGNVQISSTNSYIAFSNNIISKLSQKSDGNLGQFNVDESSKKESVAVSQTLESFSTTARRSNTPDPDLKYTYAKGKITGKADLSRMNFKGIEEMVKAQPVTSSIDEKEGQQGKSESKYSRSVKTMASSHTSSSNTITSVQAGKTQTATVTISNNSSSPPAAVSILNLCNQNIVQIPRKGQNHSHLEMVQNVVSSIQTSPEGVKNELSTKILADANKTAFQANPLGSLINTGGNVGNPILGSNNSTAASLLKTGNLQTGHVLVSGNGQYIVASNGNVLPQTSLTGLKLNPTPSMNAPPVITNATGTVTQMLPAVGVGQQMLGQPTVLVNTLPTPFVIQPGVMAVETGLGRLAVATGNVLQGGIIENNALRNSTRSISTAEKVKTKKGSKKRKNQVASLLQMTSPNNMIINQPFHHNFAVSPSANVQSIPALTLVQGKQGSAQIVMNNQNNFNQFSAQPQQINLLQPVNLTSVPNFPAFQQFIVPGLGNMVMSTDGTTTLLPDTNIGVQLQLQNVNGQNVLTPIQNANFLNGQGILTTSTGMLIRAPNNQKIIQNNASPQFLSPNSNQFLVNQFQGQLSPLIAANLSPNQQIFTGNPKRQSPQDFIQILPTSNAQNTTVVQQNTTIVQQQTTMVANNQNILNNSAKSNFILNSPSDKPVEVQVMGPSQRQSHHSGSNNTQQIQQQQRPMISQDKVDFNLQHSVSTQTSNKESNNVGVTTNNMFCQTLNSGWSGSPPDTTTHSPVESDTNFERIQSPTDEGSDGLHQAMVQYVSSSINEGESDNEAYLLSGTSKMLAPRESLSRANSKMKNNIVESSNILQETGAQIQIGNSYMPSSDQLKSIADECVVSSHSEVNIQDKQIESQSNVTSYQEEKSLLVGDLLMETKSASPDQEGIVESPVKLMEGDLVWGPVRGSPAWPGKLVGPISSGGKALVRWFGGHNSPTKVDVSQLQSLSQGLDAHHRASNKGRKNKKLNAELEAAIQEAMLELDKMTEQTKKVSSGRGRPRRINR